MVHIKIKYIFKAPPVVKNQAFNVVFIWCFKPCANLEVNTIAKYQNGSEPKTVSKPRSYITNCLVTNPVNVWPSTNWRERVEVGLIYIFIEYSC